MHLFLKICLPATVGGLLSCVSGDENIGLSVTAPQQLQVQFIDSVTIQTATVMVPDSFVTSTDDNLLVGQWADAHTGQLRGRSFASVDYVAANVEDQTGLRLDSLVLELGYAFTYGDTLTDFDLAVHPLRETLPAETYYNNSSADYETAPLLLKTLFLRPTSGSRQIRFRIPDALARSFWAKLIAGDINDADTMADFWPGFAFVGGSSSNVFVGFSAGATSGLRLYYHDTDINRTATSVLYPIQTTYFSQLVAERNGSSLQTLRQRTSQVNSGQTDKTTFVGVGLRTRIELPYLSQFDRSANYVGLNLATLTVEPVRRNDLDNAPPPAQLALYQTNSQNDILATLPAGSTGADNAVASYATDPNALELTDAYTFSLTYYVTEIIRGRLLNRPLLLTIPEGQTDLRTVVQRVTLGDGQRATDRVRLRLLVTSEI